MAFGIVALGRVAKALAAWTSSRPGAPAARGDPESIVIVCPDTNIRLWPTRLAEAATGGGKSAILRLAMARARSAASSCASCPTRPDTTMWRST
jgi:hypothetical protein